MANKVELQSIESLGPLRGRTIIVRIDVNSPIDPKTKKISANARILAHAKTLAELSNKGAKVIVLAHQGRKGGDDFLPLAQHAKLLAKASGKSIEYYPDPLVVNPQTLKKVAELKAGKIMLLDNVRYLDEETDKLTPLQQAHAHLVASLAPLAEFYVDDAFSNAHRAHASMTGFPQVLASAAGPVMLNELEGAKKAMETAKRPNIYVLGGTKPEEVIGVMKHALQTNSVDKILTSGVIGELCVIARGSALSPEKMKWLADHGHAANLLALREVIHYYHEFIETPFDFALKDPATGKRKEVFLTSLNHEHGGSWDIGKKTATKYSKIIARAKTIYLKGPCGVYEDPEFEFGTRTVFSAVAANQGAFTLVAGGNTTDAFAKLGIPTTSISHLSIGGGVLLDLMAGMPLPAVQALEEAAKKFGIKPGFHAPNPLPAPEPVANTRVHSVHTHAKEHKTESKTVAAAAEKKAVKPVTIKPAKPAKKLATAIKPKAKPAKPKTKQKPAAKPKTSPKSKKSRK